MWKSSILKGKREAHKLYRYLPVLMALCFMLYFATLVHAEWTMDKSEAREYTDLDDFKYDPGRTYEINSFGELGHFTTLGHNGIIWDCLQLGEDEAVIYAANSANGGVIEVPETIEDGVSGKMRTIVGIIAQAEKYQKIYDWEYEESPFGFVNNYGVDITGLVLPKTIRFIGRGAFYGYKNLTSVTFQSDAAHPLTIERQAFTDCTSLKDVIFNTEGEVTVEPRAFFCCTGLETISFPTGSTVSDYSLECCTGLVSVYNAPSYLAIGMFEEGETPKLTTISYAEGLTEIRGVDLEVILGVEETADGDSYYEYGRADSLKYVTIPSTAKRVEGFQRTGLETIQLPEGLETIGEEAFLDCIYLQSVNFPSSLKEIGEFAFRGCKSLHMHVKHPSNQLGYQYKDSGILSITLPNNIELIWRGGLTGCPDLQSINIEGDVSQNGIYKTKDGVLYEKRYYDEEYREWLLSKYPPAKSNGSYTLPPDVLGLGGFAFEGCKFSEIHLPVTYWISVESYMDPTEGGVRDHYYAFDDMATNPTLYIVPNSHADYDYGHGDEEGIPYVYKYTPIQYENGPAVPIVYNLNGGTNAASNPDSIPGGTSTVLENPTRSGYTFIGWRLKDYNECLEGNLLCPTGSELVDGVTVEALWKKKDDGSSDSKMKQLLKQYNAKQAAAKNLTTKSLKAKAIKGKKVKLTWAKTNTATGYQIWGALNNKFSKGLIKKTVTGVSNKTITFKKLKAKKTYYFRIRPYTRLTHPNGKKIIVYGKWSKAIKKKVK